VKWAFSGIYIQIDPLTLVHTSWDAPMGYPSVPERVTVRFSETSAGTLVTFEHEGIVDPAAREGHVQGWLNTFEALARLLAAEGTTP
jgi:hypothetical protein